MGGKVRQYHRNPDVGRWKETIESIRSRLGLSDQPGQGYPTHFVLSIIHLESSGNPYAQNKIGYTGLTQIGAQAAETIGLKNYKAALKGDGPLAIEAFFRHMEEPYMIKAHQYDYGAMAVAHNLG
ncbi:MAG: transglycosylase SLT domain-containing protein, partial [Candidatus Korarchaeota archaeon]|nr:transglycosylase SLT domain-containing protein [Candidatus Korarchaeota archaeon]